MSNLRYCGVCNARRYHTTAGCENCAARARIMVPGPGVLDVARVTAGLRTYEEGYAAGRAEALAEVAAWLAFRSTVCVCGWDKGRFHAPECSAARETRSEDADAIRAGRAKKGGG